MYEFITSGISLQHCLTVQFCSQYFLCSTLISGVIHYVRFYNLLWYVPSQHWLCWWLCWIHSILSNSTRFVSFRFVSFRFVSISIPLYTWLNCWNGGYVLSQRRPLTPSGHLHFTPPPAILVHNPSCRHVTSAHVNSPGNTQLWNQVYTNII